MRLLSSFANIHQNETIVVCGCGESLNDLENPERFITIGVNDVGRKFQPNYLVVVNPRHQFSGDRFRYVETSRAKYLFTQLDLHVKHPNIVKFKLGQLGGTDFSNPNVLNYTNNSPYIALCLAIQMGAKRVGLIGVDFTDNHFFSKTGKHPLAPRFEKINEQYTSLAKAAKALGVEIFNLSRRSRLTAFPKASFSEFDKSSQSVSENFKKSAPLKIVSYATTPVAGVPAILARCIAARSEHSARCVWATNSYGNGVKFAGDVEWSEAPEKAKSLLAEADLIILHNGKVASEHRELLKDKAILTMAHNYLWNVDEQFVRKGFPGVVVGQYQAALPEFKNWTIVPNPIPFWEAEYQAEKKPDQITICYTPSGKHEQYPREHKLYWHSKGYETTMRVLEKLSKQFGIKLEVIRNRQISHVESIAMKRRSHIVIDECVTGSYHRNSLEGLASGCVVVNGIGLLPKVVDVLRICAGDTAEIPFVPATLENLEAVLTELIESGKDVLAHKGLENRVWLEENWNFEQHWQRLWLPAVEKSLQKINRKILFDKPEKTYSANIGSNQLNGGLKMKKIKEGVSVVIPHGGKDRLPHLRACLANLRQCGDVGEIIVVEMDESPVATEIARKWADKYVFIHRSGLFERARALNTGSSFAECEFVFWLDNDLLMPHDFFTKAVAEMRSRQLDYLKPYSETNYLTAADSEKVMQGIRNPESCRPANIARQRASGRAEIVRKDFLIRCGGIPDGFRGWGGEDNAWSHKANLLGRTGITQIRKQKLFHLFHLLSGGYGGEQHKAANPHYQDNVALLDKIHAVRDAKQFMEMFPPQKYSPWNASQKIVFVAGETVEDLAARQTAQQFEELFGATVEIIPFDDGAGKISADLSEKQPDAIVFFNKRFCEELLPEKSFAEFAEKSVLIASDDFDLNETENPPLIVLTKNKPVESNGNNSKIWFWKDKKPEETDFQSLALALAQPLSVILGKPQSDFQKNIATLNQAKTGLPVWFYWEGARPDWIEVCHRTILAKAPNARFLTPETFAELWTEDRDIKLSHLYVAHRADFIRAYLLAKFGGLWLDADCIVMRDLQFLLDKLGEYDFIAHRERNGLFTNDLMAAKPGSVIARRLYEKICQTLRTNKTISWRAIGGEPLTEILHNTEVRFLELPCEQIQPVCWSEPEKFFAVGSESAHRHKFDERAICYMLSNGAIINYQKKHPNVVLTAENTFFSFLARRALNEQAANGNHPVHESLQFQAQNNGANSQVLKNENRLHALSFYLEMMAKIAPRKVLDIDVGLGRWAVLLRDLFEPSTDKKEWQMSIEAVVETKPKARDTSKFFYDRVRVGKLNDCLQSVEEKPELLILGDYLTRNPDFQSRKILEQTLNLSDYILLNLNRTNGASNHSNSQQDLMFYLESNPEQIAAYRRKDGFVSYLLSQTDPKKLRPKNRMADIFYNMSQTFSQQREESISGPGSSLRQTAEIRRSLPLLFASLGINSMLDAPCGDYNWLRHIDLKLEKYIGIDVVPSIIKQNRNRFENQIRKFYVSDITEDFLPQCDLILCRDCLVHFSFEKIFPALRNFCNSGAKYLLTTTFPQRQSNADIQTGGWRPLNFQLPPFNFPPPLQLLNEHCSEGNGKFADKSLGLWDLSEINTQV